MAGKRQHYVPRLLQRGFLHDPADEAERTWLHRANAPARLVGIRDVGVEDWFYSRKAQAGEQTLDDLITEFERDLGKDVRQLREAAPGTAIEPAQAARTVVHLVMRTAHLRRTISNGVQSATDEIEALFTSPEQLGSMLGSSRPGLASAVTDGIRKSAEDLVPAGYPATLSERLLTFFVRERGEELAAQAVAPLEPLLPTLFAGLRDKVRDMHNALLKKPVDDHGWVDSDIGEASLIALQAVSAIVGHAADWLGHRDGLADGQPFAGSDLPTRLGDYGLDRWIEVFGRDLAACYTVDGALDLSVVITLSPHIERLFWTFGVYCWPDGNDVKCVVSDHPLRPAALNALSDGSLQAAP